MPKSQPTTKATVKNLSKTFAKLMHFHKNRVEDLKTAVSEACSNAIEHGNRLKKNTMVLITLKMGTESLEVDIKDQGKGLYKTCAYYR